MWSRGNVRAWCYVELSIEQSGNGMIAAYCQSQIRLAPDHCTGHVFEPFETKVFDGGWHC